MRLWILSVPEINTPNLIYPSKMWHIWHRFENFGFSASLLIFPYFYSKRRNPNKTMKSHSKHAPAVSFTALNLNKFDQYIEEKEDCKNMPPEIQQSLEELIRGCLIFSILIQVVIFSFQVKVRKFKQFPKKIISLTNF
jgi:hypothetical protein